MKNKFINSDRFYKNALTLPLNTRINKRDVEFVIDKLKKFFN